MWIKCFFKQIYYWYIIKKDNFKCLKLQNDTSVLTNKGSQKEVCWLSTQINFDSCKCDAAQIIMWIDSAILVESDTLVIYPPFRCSRCSCAFNCSTLGSLRHTYAILNLNYWTENCLLCILQNQWCPLPCLVVHPRQLIVAVVWQKS